MKPYKLIVSAFGSYAAKNEIDMSLLGENGLYLITGDTGAGKTTIFDAITYALFGEVSGNIRETSMLRSKYADPSTPTEVELTFSYDENLYIVRRNPEYMRMKRSGNGSTVQKAEAELVYPDGKVITKRAEVNKAIHDILGIDYNQFTKIAMIAQGEFQKLLIAPTKERKEIFRKLFYTEPYQMLQEKLKAEASEISKKCEEYKRGITQYISDIQYDETLIKSAKTGDAQNGLLPMEEIIALIGSTIENDNTQLQKENNELEKTEHELEEINNLIGRAEETEKIKISLKSAEASLENRLEREKNALKTLLDLESDKPEIKRITEKNAVLKSTLLRYDELDKLNIQLSAGKKLLSDKKMILNEKNEKKESDLKVLMSQKEELESLKDSGETRERLESSFSSTERNLNNLVELQNDIKSFLVEKNSLAIARDDYKKSLIKSEALLNKYSKMNTIFLNEQAGILAETLRDDEKCPVCGSLNHPSPAVKTENAPSELELKKIKKESESAGSETASLSAEAGRLSGKLDAKKNEILRKCDILISKSDTIKAEEVINEDYNVNENMSEFLSQKVESVKKELKVIKTEINIEEKKVNRKKEIEILIPKREESVNNVEKEITAVKEEIASLESKLMGVEENIKKQTEELSFESRDKAESALREAEKIISNYQESLDAADKVYKTAKTEIDELTGKINNMKEQLENSEEIDIEENSEIKNGLMSIKESLRVKMTNLSTRLSHNKTCLEKIKRQSEDLLSVESELIWVKSLSDTANGSLSGKEKIMLETYIQTTYFDRIISRANTRLMIMTDGQYELKRSDEAENNQSQSGLDLNVTDHYNGSERSVKSLSGGESFMASLSLALGLSDEIQSSCGGIHIDSMFVDEGFGSLDDESLQQAIKALSSLTEGNRIVGIISHVSELKEKIDKQIVVTKEKTGGSIASILI